MTNIQALASKIQNGFKQKSYLKTIILIFILSSLIAMSIYAIVAVNNQNDDVKEMKDIMQAMQSKLKEQQKQLDEKICNIKMSDGSNLEMKFGDLIPTIFQLKVETNTLNTKVSDLKLFETTQTKIYEDLNQKFNDFNTNLEKKIQVIETEQSTAKNNISTLTSNLNTEVQDRKLLETKQQKTTFVYAPTIDYTWQFTASKLQMHTHPQCILKHTFSMKSYVFANIKGYMINFSPYGCRVYLLRDSKPYFDDFNGYHLGASNTLSDLNVVAQFVIEPGTYIFSIGVYCFYNFEVKIDAAILSLSSTNIQ